MCNKKHYSLKGIKQKAHERGYVMRRYFKRFLGYLLTIALIFSDLSILAYAKETVDISDNLDVSTEDEGDLLEPEIISELTEKRDETTKYFAMSDGTIKACIYPQNVHFLEEGKYEEIDNTLVKSEENEKNLLQEQEK